jgi:subtilisin-like proprotein convertase family protein
VQYFNGTYLVEEVPYNPADTTFSLGTGMLNPDDNFTNEFIDIPFPFYFFGIQKNQFRVGANGMITFCSPSDFGSGDFCPYSFHTNNNQLPWNQTGGHMTPSGNGDMFNRMHDAIYGVYEDTHPSYGVYYGSERIHYGIIGQFPCRKIIASWNEVPLFGNTDILQSYQIVCYEGTNIIEVHVKHRGCCPTTSDALIGIQNATGQPQQPGIVGSSNRYVVDGSPAAFWPEGYNGFTSSIEYTSYRFTPQGMTNRSVKWYRIFDDGRDSIVLPEMSVGITDTNGYFEAMNEYDSQHPTLTKATVSPTTTSRYVIELQFNDAGNNVFTLRDTVVVALRNPLVIAEPSNDTMGIVIGGGEYSEGSLTTLIAAPFAGYAFTGWDNGVLNNPYGLLVDSDTTLVANFMRMDAIHDTICPGNNAEAAISQSVIGRDFIPDGPSCPQNSHLSVPMLIDDVPDHCAIVSPDDIQSICVNLEHSFMGDLTITVVCPNGSEAILKYGRGNSDSPFTLDSTVQSIISVTGNGGGYSLGAPIDGVNGISDGSDKCDSLDQPFGVGFDYCFSRNTGYTLASGDDAGTVWSDTMPYPVGGYYITSISNNIDIITVEFNQIPPYFLNHGGEYPGSASLNTKHPSNHADKSDYYLPTTTFEELVGCPVKGVWELRIYDAWGIDNGWAFGWNMDLGHNVYSATIHDTTYITLTDTLTVTDTLWLYDTVSVDNYIYDTVIVNHYYYDTTIVSNHDTVNNYYYDTVIISHYYHDTVIVNNYVYDTIYLNHYIFDTIYIHDTVFVDPTGIDGTEVVNAKIYQRDGQIVVECADGNTVTLYDVNGRMLATKQDDYTAMRFEVPASGTYLVKIGNFAARRVVVIR